MIQTNNPDSEIIRLACAQDYESFYEREIRMRRLLSFPPFCDIALLTLSGFSESEVLRASVLLSEMIKSMTGKEYDDVTTMCFGPFEAPVYKVEGKYRIRMVIKCRLNKKSRELFSLLLKKFGKEGASRPILTVDFNPTGL